MFDVVASTIESHVQRANLVNPFAQFTTVHGETFSDAIGRILDDSHENEKLYDGHNSDVAISVKRDGDGYWVVVGYLPVPAIYGPSADEGA